MKPIEPEAFERKPKKANSPDARYLHAMIRSDMNRADWMLMLGLAVIWGSAFFFIGVAVRHVEPLTYVWLRVTIAAAALWTYLKIAGRPAELPRQVWGSILVLAILNNALPFALFGWGQTHIASGLASILNATTPIWGVLVAHLYTDDERLSPRKLAGLLLGFAGVATMIGSSLLADIGSAAIAELACVAAALSYALAAVWARRFKRRGVSPLAVTTGQLSASALIMLPVAMIVDRPWTHAWPSATAWGAIIALAVVCTAFAYVLYFKLINSAGATNALLVTLLVPPVAILLGSLFLGELLAIKDFAGLVLIALGLAAIDGRLLKLLARQRRRRAA